MNRKSIVTKWFYFVLLALLMALLSACGTGYREKDGSFIYVTWNESSGRQAHAIQGIDPDSFQVLNKRGYAKDKMTAYFRWKRIAGSEPQSFSALSEIYAKDAYRVYYEDEIVPTADPATWVLMEVEWAKDKKDVFLQNMPIAACDPASFEFLSNDWQRDSKCVYKRGGKLSGADPKSFVVINYWYGKDKQNVYHNNRKIIEGADPFTFKLASCDVCAKDKNRCYKYDRVVDCLKN
jgi:hypothetical protein